MGLGAKHQAEPGYGIPLSGTERGLAVPLLALCHPAFPIGALTSPLQDPQGHQDFTCTSLKGTQPITQKSKNLNQVLLGAFVYYKLPAKSRSPWPTETTRNAAQVPGWAGRLPLCMGAHFHSLPLIRRFISGLTSCPLTRGQTPSTYTSTGNFTGEMSLTSFLSRYFS